MTIRISPRDKVSTRAAREMFAPAARKVVQAMADSTAGLRDVMGRDPRYPADPRSAFAALMRMRREQAAVDQAVAEYAAWLIQGGVSRSALARGFGIRPETLARMLAPVENIASARHPDLHRREDGTWVVRRLDRVEEAL